MHALDAYRPDASWYLHNPRGIHGRGHACRVLAWANHLARASAQDGQAVDLEAVRWAAVLHDVRRVSDGPDPEHGARAAAWVREHAQQILPPGLGAETVERIAYVVRWHVPDDQDAPELTPELIVLKDADSLDRVRLGPGRLDVRYLRTSLARELPAAAGRLWRTSATSATGDPWTRSRAAAIALGVWA